VNLGQFNVKFFKLNYWEVALRIKILTPPKMLLEMVYFHFFGLGQQGA